MVFFATPVMRSVLRIELPSTKATITWTRLAVLSWFMPYIILERLSISPEKSIFNNRQLLY